MAYDGGRGRVVLFGGTVNQAKSADTWEYDGTTWLQITASGPPARAYHAMVYDSARRGCLLFGGVNSVGLALHDTWQWDGSAWLQRNPTATPEARSLHAMAFDGTRGRAVLFGGGTTSGKYANTYEWDGTTWTLLSTPTSPDPRAGHAMAFDAARNQVVLFGGAGPAETWLYGRGVPAFAATFGAGCAGSRGTPDLSSGMPCLGNAGFVLDLLGAGPGLPCAIGIATGVQDLALGGGCSLYLRDAVAWLPAATSPAGFASLKLMIPKDPGLQGAVAYAQSFVADPLGAFSGLSLTRGLLLRVGY